MKISPAHTRHSLLASATRRPCETAASVGGNPAAPMMPAITQSAGRVAASMSALCPAAASMPVPARQLLSSPYRLSSATTASRARCWMAASASAAALPLAVTATTSNMLGLRPMRSSVLCPTDPVAPSTLTRLAAVAARAPRTAAFGTASASLALIRGTGTPPGRSRPEQQGACRRMHVDGERRNPDGGRRRHQAVDAIHHAPMARQYRA